MAMFRTAKQENPFVQIDKHFIEDKALSWDSKGILTYMLSRPPGWQIRKEDLVRKSSGGKSRVETALLNLMANGYLNWYSIRGEDGQIKDWVYDVYERPDFNPEKEKCIAEGKRRIEKNKERNKKKNAGRKTPKKVPQPESGNPEVDNPAVDNPAVDNPPYSNNELNNNDLNNIYKDSSNNHHLEQSSFTDEQTGYINTFIKQNKIDDEDLINMLVNRLVGKDFHSINYVGTTYNSIIKDLNSNPGKIEKLKDETENKSFIDFLQGNAAPPEDLKGDTDNFSSEEIAAMLKDLNERKMA